MAEIQLIVESLNQHPFNLDLTLVSFSQKSPFELRVLLNDVLANISSSQPRDLREEPPEATTQRMLEFLRTLKYRPQMDGASFRQGLLLGSTEVIYPVLVWLLSQLPLLQKRAYLAKFLVDVELPEELMVDDETRDLHVQCKGLQEQFKEVHKTVELFRRTKKDPLVVKDQIAELEAEREQLNSKIDKLKAKLQNVPKVGMFLEVAGQLRKQQEEEIQLRESLKEQKAALESTKGRHVKVLSRLRDLRATSASGSSAALLQVLTEEVNLIRYAAKEKLPKEIEKKKMRLQSIQSVLKDPVSNELDISALQAELVAANGEVSAMLEERARERMTTGPGNAKGGAEKEVLYRQQAQMAAMVAKKKEAAFMKLESLAERKRALLREIDQRTAAMDQMKLRVPRGDGGVQYSQAESLREMMEMSDAMKKELDDLADEFGGLQRTLILLQQQEAELQTATSDTGLRQPLPATLESPTEGGFSLDGGMLTRGGVAEAEAGHVLRIGGEIRERRSSVKYQISELKNMRMKAQELEADHREKHRQFDEITVVATSQQDKLEEELMQLLEDCQREESRYHQLNCQTQIVDTTLRRVMEEEGTTEGGKQLSSLSDKYRARIGYQEEITKALREKQRKLKELEVPNQAQMVMLKDLRSLMNLKLQLYRGEVKPQMGRPALEIRELGGANRLIIASDG
ncbi:hypothetical protein CBR_g37536 [Chara braunii]|uniref:IFT81 calponin homology domain-containing protein n=1 Tax=Chara braunii TaxID=69332 RepID=A0A388LNB8_CHABU|nr:hypothetical protein CBR_g37536 [Chara braunii]|eukprot:GBG83735.1 hypothetical protein CBR_g37536 [Chara braunii]